MPFALEDFDSNYNKISASMQKLHTSLMPYLGEHGRRRHFGGCLSANAHAVIPAWVTAVTGLGLSRNDR